jgi:hypothetical protein
VLRSESTKTKSTVSHIVLLFIVRVGGGYLSIDEFIDQFTGVELERLERKDPLKRFSEKVAVQMTIAGR